MMKHRRSILISSVILALVALAGLTMVAFAQGEKAPVANAASSEPGLAILDGERTGVPGQDLVFQEPLGDRRARPFIQQRMRENLAQALGISPEELDEARWTAFMATLGDAVEEGYLAEQAADRMVAQAVIRRTADRDELIAAGLGITVDELQAARDEGKTPRQLVDELGLDATAIGQNLASFLEELILQAAEDGLISDDQANRILDDELLERLARGLWRPWRPQQRPPAQWGRGQ